MPWWGKSSSKETKKKEQKESFIESIYQRIRSSPSERENCVPERHSRKSSNSVAKRGSASRGLSISPSPSTRISRHQSFVERPEAQPLPLPQEHLSTVFCTKSDTSKPAKQGVDNSLRPLLFPSPQKCGCTASTADTLDAEVELSIASDSSDISIRSDPADFLLLSPLASENNRRNKTPIHTPHCSKKIDYNQKSRPFSLVPDDQILSTSPKEKILSSYVQVLQVPHDGAPCGAPDSSKSSPSWSATRAASPDQNTSSIFAAIKSYKDTDSFGPGQCSTANYLPGADLSGRLFQQQHRCSPECSPVPSPRVRSPGPCSRIQSGAVTPLHSLSPGPSSIIHSRCSPECSPLPSPRMASPDPCSRIQSGAVTPLHSLSPGPSSIIHSRCSPEYSPLPSPRMASPGPGSRTQSGTVTPPYPLSPGPSSRTHSSAVNPLHPRGEKTHTEASELWPDDGRQKGHPLPLPPIIIPSSQFSPSCSATATPSRSPSRVEYRTCSVSEWKKGRLLGSGSYGHVYLAFNRETGEICAMKEVTMLSDDTKSKECTEQLRQEIVLLSRLQHPNIVQYLGSEMIDDRFCIYLEYVSGGSIYKLLQDYGPFGESAIRNYTQQILSGLAYLHAKNTVHRDIKGANILVDPTGRVKLADFGMAKHITGQACPLSLKGTPNWMAPEVIKNSNGCNLAVDIWSLGCTVLEMATAKPPWSHYGGVAALFKIGNSRELPVIPDDLSNEGKEFVMLCLQRNPFDRPTAAQLLMHRFVKNASPFDMTIAGAETTQLPYAITDAVQALGIGQGRNASSLESEGIVLRQARGSGIGPAYSEAQTPRNESFPISPVGSPLLHSRSPRYRIPMMSSPISSPHAVSGSSTPLSCSGDTILPMYYSPDNTGLQWSQTCAYMNDGTFYEKSKTSQGDIYEQSVLADQVSQKLLGDRDKLKPPQSCITLA